MLVGVLRPKAVGVVMLRWSVSMDVAAIFNVVSFKSTKKRFVQSVQLTAK